MIYQNNDEEYIHEEYPLLWLALYKHLTHKDAKITFQNYLYMKSIYMDKSDYIVLQKGSQSGASEYLIIRALYSLMKGNSVFYVMPTESMRNLFVSDRFNRSLDYAPFYSEHFSTLSKSETDNVGLKHFGKGSINFVGSISSKPFFSYPADELIIDELDKCDQNNIAIADERLSASKCKKIIKVSNPTTVNFGINREYNMTDKKKWFIKCGRCGEWVNPDFFNNVVMEVEQGVYVLRDNDPQPNKDIRMVCKCGGFIDRFDKGQWVPEKLSTIRSGYIISKLFSTNVTIKEMVEKFEEGLKNETIMERFYNGDLGLAYSSSGTQITTEILDACKRDYQMPKSSQRVCVMGIDVGTVLHTVIGEVDPDGYVRIVYIGKVREIEEIFALTQQYNVKFGCIDALPETRLSKKLCYRLKGFFMVYFGNTKKDTINIEAKTIVINRTESFDRVKEAFSMESITLPQNADKLIPVNDKGVSEFYSQMSASTRLFDEKKQVYYWDEGGNPDHFCLAVNYMLTAKKLVMKLSK